MVVGGVAAADGVISFDVLFFCFEIKLEFALVIGEFDLQVGDFIIIIGDVLVLSVSLIF